jgi:hypothetical protein
LCFVPTQRLFSAELAVLAEWEKVEAESCIGAVRPLAIGIHSMNADEGLRAAIATYLAALMARGYSAEQAKAAALELLDEERKARIQNRRKALRVVDN